MKSHLIVFGLAFGVACVPRAGIAQNFTQNLGTGDLTSAAPGMAPVSGSNGANLNPFMGAAGADRFYQDNSLGSPSPSSPSAFGAANNPASTPGTVSGPYVSGSGGFSTTP